MGLGASLTALCSITTRLSDNELRAQMISNSKMRLANESSQVSENYINALNDAQLMFTNYGADNSSAYQKLTFNALTAYNPYNNQYGLSNMAGQLLVSEADTLKYENALKSDDPLTTFLESYGLKYETTFFDNLEKNKLSTGKIPYNDIDALTGETIAVSTGYTSEELETIFYGGTTKTNGTTVNHMGYETALTSMEYYEYNKLVDNYNSKYTNYNNLLSSKMTAYTKTWNSGSYNITDLMSSTIPSTGSWKDALDAVANMVKNNRQYAIDGTSNKYYTNVLQAIEDFKNPTYYPTVALGNEGGANNSITMDKAYASGTFDPTDEGTYYMEIVKNGTSYKAIFKDANGNDVTNQIIGPTITFTGENDDDSTYNYGVTNSLTYGTDTETGNPQFYLTQNVVSSDNTTAQPLGSSTLIYQFTNWDTTAPEVTVKEQNPTISEDNYKSFVNNLLISILSNANNQYNLEEFYDKIVKPSGENSQALIDARKEYLDAGNELAAFVFGTGTTLNISDYQNLLNLDWIMYEAKDANNNQLTHTDEFNVILDIDTMEKVFNTYGEPVYAWIDKTNPNQNGEQKAEWYTNLFNRMSQGYKSLSNGLASSAEWIKFALESGMLVMEQVDKSQNWTSFIYSNCSDITEQTDNTAIAIAEAQYTRDMNKIEHKDKMYDMELKNIDTEHSALQTEYESIKTAMDKNIERSFTIYNS